MLIMQDRALRVEQNSYKRGKGKTLKFMHFSHESVNVQVKSLISSFFSPPCFHDLTLKIKFCLIKSAKKGKRKNRKSQGEGGRKNIW